MDAAELVDNSNGDFHVSPGGMHYNANTGELNMVIQNVTMKRSLIGVSGGDNVKLLGPSPSTGSGGQWLQTAGNINMWTMQAFDMAIEARMGLEKIHASEALVNNRLANGGLAGKYSVLRESGGYMRRFRTISKYGGRAFFGVGTFFSIMDAGFGISERDWGRVTFAGLDILVSSVLFFSGAGIMAIPIYLLYKNLFTPPEIKGRPFNPNELLKPYYCEPDNLRVDSPFN